MNYFAVFNSPIGCLYIENDDYFLLKSGFKDDLCCFKGNDLTLNAINQLNEYFSGGRKIFNLPINPKGTEFQKKVWSELLKIPYGRTLTYKDIAVKIGNTNASRAAGNAINKNPLPVIIPCHRVIGSSNKLTGYAFGLDIKQKLLNLEKKYTL